MATDDFAWCARLLLLVLLRPANEVWGKVMFLHLSVILFIGVGCGRHLPRQTPSWQTPPRADPPKRQLKWVVHILLECILVFLSFHLFRVVIIAFGNSTRKFMATESQVFSGKEMFDRVTTLCSESTTRSNLILVNYHKNTSWPLQLKTAIRQTVSQCITFLICLINVQTLPFSTFSYGKISHIRFCRQVEISRRKNLSRR